VDVPAIVATRRWPLPVGGPHDTEEDDVPASDWGWAS